MIQHVAPARRLRIVLASVLPLLLVLVLPAGRAAADAASSPLGPDQLVNGSFDAGDDLPDSWTTTAWQPTATFARDSTVAIAGSASARIQHKETNDSAFIQELHVKPDTPYLVSGWIRTEGVSADGVGANLSEFGTWNHTEGIHGTQGWTQVGLVVESGPTGVITVGARLGYWAGTSTGTASFDALQVNEISESSRHRNWNIQAIIYERIDTTVIDANGLSHHVRSTIPADPVATAADAVRSFVQDDIPVLDSGNMVPKLLPVTIPSQPLTTLSSIGPGEWYPGPADGRSLRNPDADALIVIWEPNATDVDTGQPFLLSGFGGLAPAQGVQTTYMTAILDSLTVSGTRNVLKHEFGHSILSYFDATGWTPAPTVTNHAEAGQYVHCGTGAAYDWRDETLADPIPNSIYSNDAGFTHDYYSGTTALPADPGHCLGITPEAWARGGPLHVPALPPLPSQPPGGTARVQLDQLRTDVQSLVAAGSLRQRDADPLLRDLSQASRDLDNDHRAQAAKRVARFIDDVSRLRARHRITSADATKLTTEAEDLLAALQPRRHPRHDP